MKPNDTYSFSAPLARVDLHRVVVETGLDRDDGPRVVECTIDGKAYTFWDPARVPGRVDDGDVAAFLDLYPGSWTHPTAHYEAWEQAARDQHALRAPDREICVWVRPFGSIRSAVGRHARQLLDSVEVVVESYR